MGELGGGGALGPCGASRGRCSSCWALPGWCSHRSAPTWGSSCSRGRRATVGIRAAARAGRQPRTRHAPGARRGPRPYGNRCRSRRRARYWAAPALVQFASASQRTVVLISHRIFGCWRSPLGVDRRRAALRQRLRRSRLARRPVVSRDARSRPHATCGCRGGPRTLVIVQVALSVVSLVGAGLFAGRCRI